MQREIKYKLWDTEKEFMLNCYELIFVQGGIKASDGCTTQGWVKVNKGFENKIKPTLIAIEYTGLHDKDGKDIYEGDIIQYNEGKRQYHAEIKWIDGDLESVWIECCYLRTDLSYWVKCKAIEVVGNVYENPKLLDQEEIT